MTNFQLSSLDFHLLYYFSIVAEEQNLHRAAERLFMSQPPLSRYIKRLEERLGLALFIRHTKGLVLTEDGVKVLEKIHPLLELYARTVQELAELKKPLEKRCAVGFTTAFEQGIFSEIERRLWRHYGKQVQGVRKSSPKLVRDVRKGRLDAAFVALPIEAAGLSVLPLKHEEPLMAVVPESWPEAKHHCVSLQKMSGKVLFWFQRKENPAYFDYMQGIFKHIGFTPHFCEEPAEHDVLLARIASGEGMGLMPESFSTIRRAGVIFIRVKEIPVQIKLGIVCLEHSFFSHIPI